MIVITTDEIIETIDWSKLMNFPNKYAETIESKTAQMLLPTSTDDNVTSNLSIILDTTIALLFLSIAIALIRYLFKQEYAVSTSEKKNDRKIKTIVNIR